ncbi:Uncharacterised protein [Escherichia coli]|nr:Uncharacterised protein [Escherichia coli]
MLPVNQVFRMGELRKRLLWSGTEQAIWIDIDSDTALPEPISIAELERLLMERELESIADPFEETVLREVEEGSLDQQKRDEAWAMLADFVHDPPAFRAAPQRAHCQRHHGAPWCHQSDGVQVTGGATGSEACAGMPSCRTMSTRAPVASAESRTRPSWAGPEW